MGWHDVDHQEHRLGVSVALDLDGNDFETATSLVVTDPQPTGSAPEVMAVTGLVFAITKRAEPRPMRCRRADWVNRISTG
ncbi:MAG: hypothetical protein ACRDWN_09790 [Acidimicrobiales bacterium]